MTLRELPVRGRAEIASVGGNGALRQHFLDMGIIPGARVKLVKYAPMGDPMELLVHDYSLTLRLADAGHIEIRPVEEFPDETVPGDDALPANQAVHPGFGEEGKYHASQTETSAPLPAGTCLRFALVGNQNCGKTTLFNQLTGSNQHVGNFPGVTVCRKDGVIRKHPATRVTDLPGIYSMSPYSAEELLTREFILDEKPHAIINIVDATNVTRNLYLTMQLLELEIPVVLALNMMDEVRNNGGAVLVNKMEAALGIPVIPIVAAKGEGVEELIHHAMHIARYQEGPRRQDFCDVNEHNGAVHRAIHSIIHLVEDHAQSAGIPRHFAASKIIEGDKRILDRLELDANEKATLEHIILQMEKECGLDRSAAIADMRFSFIRKVCAFSVRKPHESKEYRRSRAIDRLLTGKYTALPCFFAIMALVFYLTFGVIGAFFQGVLENAIRLFADWTSGVLEVADASPILRRLILDGVFTGVGSVLSFLPIIVTLFFFLSLLEDSGYIARVAFVMDKLFRKIGLSGRSIVPMLIGFGCTVPAVMATRTLPSARARKMTILLTPFMSCSAKLPIYAFFVAAFFPRRGALVMTALYLAGVALGLLAAFALKKTLFRSEAVPFVMELPNYRLPGLKNVAQLLWEKTKDFLQRAFTVIFIASLVIWFLGSFDTHMNIVDDGGDSMLAAIASMLAPVMAPLGLGDWRVCVSLITGFTAKESVVSTLNVLFGDAETLHAFLTPCAAGALLVFTLLYTPCAAAIAAIRRELGVLWATGVAVWQFLIAWGAGYLVKILWRFF
ncbi:MAG: ferrous iron transport protein B [Victivallaceae bacterium]|nr:ferrous iron transport protein B [Victivallaceae bacterium]